MNFWQKLIRYPKYYWKSTSQYFFLFTTTYNSYWLTEMMIYLLDIDIEADFQDEYHGLLGYFKGIRITNNFTALHVAAERGNVEVVRLLLDQDANITAKVKFRERESQAIHLAAERGRCEVVELLLDRGANIETKDNNGQAALHRAASRNDRINILNLLLDRGANIEAKDERGQTALHHAASRNRIDILKLLLDQGASVEAKDDDGQTALHYAAGTGNVEAIRLLLDRGVSIEAKDKRGQTALHEAASRNDRILKLLLDRGADIEAKDGCSQTALHRAAERGRIQIVNLLLNRGADIEAKDKYDQTALHKAAAEDHVHMVELLLNRCANNIEAKDKYDKTPIDLAIGAFINDTKHGAQLIILLASHGAAISKNNKDRLKEYRLDGDGLDDIVIKSSLEYHTDIKAPKLSRAASINSFEQALVLTSNNSNTGSQFLPADTAAHVISYLQDEIIHPNTNNQLAHLANEVNNAASFEPDSITNKIKDILKQGAQVSHQKSVALAAVEQRYRSFI